MRRQTRPHRPMLPHIDDRFKKKLFISSKTFLHKDGELNLVYTRIKEYVAQKNQQKTLNIKITSQKLMFGCHVFYLHLLGLTFFMKDSTVQIILTCSTFYLSQPLKKAQRIKNYVSAA